MFCRLRESKLKRMRWQDRIVIIPGVRSGKPCIKGTRITVYDVLEYLAGGMTEAQILADFPDLTAEDIRACLAFAASPISSRMMPWSRLLVVWMAPLLISHPIHRRPSF